MDESPLLALPDDALLAVLAFLPPRQLFSCRVLCRRLRDLCLHRDLWRRVRMWERSMWRAALSLAPCLRELDLYDMDDLVEVAVEVAGNACAVAELSLNVKNDDDVMAATEIVKKIAGLGGLTAFRLFISNYRFGEEFDLGELFKAVNNVDHLTCLEVHNELLSGEVASYDSEGSPSVKKLIYFSRTKDSLLGTLIETHAATLEYVHLDTEHVPMSALAECPRLRSLTFELNPKEDLSELKALPSLAALDFACDVSASPGALKLLCGAPHLRSVHLRSVNNFSRSEPLPLPLRALAASPSARHLEVLDVDVFNYMIAALPEFPSLRDLTLTVDSRHIEDFLRAVSPSAAPRLAMLALFDAGGACPHALLHRAAVESLLDRNPRLHLRVLNVGPCSYEPKCEWCKLGCQADFKAAYASHAKGDDCPRDCQRLPC